MKRIFNNIVLIGSALILGMAAVSCEAYLDKEADSTISEETPFVNFRNFQGFVEEIYNCIPDKENATGVRLGTGAMMKSSILRLTTE